MKTDENAPNQANPLDLLRIIKDMVRSSAWRAVEQTSLTLLQRIPNNAEALMYLGIARAGQGFEPEGETLLLTSLTFDPQNKDAYYHLGIIVLEQGRCMLASEAFRKGLSIDPTSHPLQYQMGRALERLGNHEESLVAYQQALIHTPKNGQSDDFTSEAKAAIARLQDPNRADNQEVCKE